MIGTIHLQDGFCKFDRRLDTSTSCSIRTKSSSSHRQSASLNLDENLLSLYLKEYIVLSPYLNSQYVHTVRTDCTVTLTLF